MVMTLIMKNLKSLSNEVLHSETRQAVIKERVATTIVLHHLREVERRRLFSAMAYSSLFEYCQKELGYSESSAQRRISSMRLMKELPEIETQIEDGKLSLSVIAQAQSFFRQEAREGSHA